MSTAATANGHTNGHKPQHPIDLDKVKAAIDPAINGSAAAVIANQPATPALGTAASSAIMRATDDSCDQIQGAIDLLTDLQAKLHSESAELAQHIQTYTTMAANIAAAFKEVQREGKREMQEN